MELIDSWDGSVGVLGEAPPPDGEDEEGWLAIPTWAWWAAGAGGAALVLIGVVYAVTRK